jgi:hypothetical protein
MDQDRFVAMRVGYSKGYTNLITEKQKAHFGRCHRSHGGTQLPGMRLKCFRANDNVSGKGDLNKSKLANVEQSMWHLKCFGSLMALVDKSRF